MHTRPAPARTHLDLVGPVHYHRLERILNGNSKEELVTAEVSNMTGKVITVRGPIDPDELGPTLMQEHLFIALYKGVGSGRLRSGH